MSSMSRKRTMEEAVAELPRHEFSDDDDDDTTAEERDECLMRVQLEQARREKQFHLEAARAAEERCVELIKRLMPGPAYVPTSPSYSPTSPTYDPPPPSYSLTTPASDPDGL